MVVVKLNVDLDVGCSRNTGNASTFFYDYLLILLLVHPGGRNGFVTGIFDSVCLALKA